MNISSPSYHIVGIGNAIVDVIAGAEDVFLERENLTKGSMQLIDTARAQALYALMKSAQESSGGSAANTLAGMAGLGMKCAFIGQVADDQLGAVFTHDIRAAGIDFNVPPLSDAAPTARCLILVTPDGERTMNTYLGATSHLPDHLVDENLIANASILYLEGYLWDSPQPQAAMKKAIKAAHKAGRKVAFTLSDVFVIEQHRAAFLQMLENGDIDILFANEGEICALAQTDDWQAAVQKLAPKTPLLVVTRGADGALCIQDGQHTSVPAQKIEKLIDTTGAGDHFAAGFLTGYCEGQNLKTALTMGAVAAAEIISHYGARPQRNVRAMIEQSISL